MSCLQIDLIYSINLSMALHKGCHLRVNVQLKLLITMERTMFNVTTTFIKCQLLLMNS